MRALTANRFDLGTHSYAVTTSNADAQQWFDLGLNWCFGFNHGEAAKCFERCLKQDPECAMAHWGIAYASGPFYNYPWRHFGPDELATRTRHCHQNIERARQLSSVATRPEQALIEALGSRFPQPLATSFDDCDRCDDDYRDAMRVVHQRFPDDHDVMALFVEALITRTPWRLWEVTTGEPAKGADTIEALEVCERSIALSESAGEASHPGVLHLHIHTLEMSHHPEHAMRSADELATLGSDNGHLNHMPAHIYVLCGQYEKARLASTEAIAADNNYVDYAGPLTFFTTNRCHDLHLMIYTCMLQGRFVDAMNAADQICEMLTPEVLGVNGLPQLAATMEGYFSMRMHVLVRFGRWQDIVDAPLPPDPELYCVSLAMHHYAKGVAEAALGNFESAELHREAFDEAITNIPKSRRFFNNAATNVLAVGEKMLDGELAYHQGDVEEAFEHLRESVRRDDDLAYTEPWAWMHPPRHALGALLIEQRQHAEAEAVYRADLGLDDSLQRCSQHPKNVWSLHGLIECLATRGETQDRARFEELLALALAEADVPIVSSCMCQGATAADTEAGGPP
jgi:tetratricopeptide (TPR) repeat protein